MLERLAAYRYGFIGFFCALQSLAVVVNAPIGALRSVPGFLLHSPAIAILSDWILLAAFVTLVNLVLAAGIAGLSYLASLSGVHALIVKQAAYAGCIFVYLLSSLLTFVAELPPGTLSGSAKLLIAALPSLGIATLVVRHASFDSVAKRLLGIGAAITIAIVALLPLPIARGVRIVPYTEIKNSAGNPPITAASGRNVIVVVADALSAPEMSLYGAAAKTTPKLDALAQTGTVVDGLTAASNFTVPTTASLYSGLYPDRHGVASVDSYFIADTRFPTTAFLARTLQKNGYITAAVIANVNAYPLKLHISDQFNFAAMPGQPPYTIVGLLWSVKNANLEWNSVLFPFVDQIVRAAIALGGQAVIGDSSPDLSYRRALEWLDHDRDRSRPFLLWVHTMPPHAPYLPPPPHRQMFDHSEKFLSAQSFAAVAPWLYGASQYRPLPPDDVRVLHARYRENIHFADDRFAAFFEALRARGLLNSTIVLFTGDHGESFKRWLTHEGPYLDDDLIKVPFVVWGPGIRAGARIRQSVSQVDIAPTILDFAQVRKPAQMEGRSVRPLLEGTLLADVPVFSMQLEKSSRFAPIARGTLCIIEGNWKYIEYRGTGKSELFQIKDGRQGPDDVKNTYPEVASRLRRAIALRFGRPHQ
jgi:arylsulfatase A-like enzyme